MLEGGKSVISIQKNMTPVAFDHQENLCSEPTTLHTKA